MANPILANANRSHYHVGDDTLRRFPNDMTVRQLAMGIGGVASSVVPATNWRRLVFALLLATAAAAPGQLGTITRAALVDAYVQVSVFVTATLLLFYGLERAFRIDAAALMRASSRWQVPVAAAFGALPGCGGAIFVVAAYSRGRLSFGAVMAALTATMGDAAFLLLATRPSIGLLVICITFTVGILSGWITDALLRDPLRARPNHCAQVVAIGQLRRRDLLFSTLAVPGLALGVLALAQVDTTALIGPAANAVGLAGAGFAILIWAVSPVGNTTSPADPPLTRATEETSFVTVWVISAFLLYEYAAGLLGLDLALIAQAAAPVVPLLAVLIGFVPGCGPQVLMTALYLSGVIPFAALIGNAISNDGDALFPALAIDQRAAVLATLYSAIPALLVAYGFYFFGPAF